MTPAPRGWSTHCQEPALTDDESERLAGLYHAMDLQPRLTVHVDNATQAEQDAFAAACEGDTSTPAMAAKQDALRRYLRAQLRAGQDWARRERARERALRASVTTSRVSSAQMELTL